MTKLHRPPPKASALRVAVELLMVLPAEAEQAVVKSTKLQELRAELGAHLPRVVGVVSTMLLQQGSPCFLLGSGHLFYHNAPNDVPIQ